jgi:hypothetical protein
VLPTARDAKATDVGVTVACGAATAETPVVHCEVAEKTCSVGSTSLTGTAMLVRAFADWTR